MNESLPPTSSTKPYLLRALYEWCTDNGLTPYLAVQVDSHTQVPKEHVKNGEIVLNISFDATKALRIENDWIQFSARFGGVSRDISVPVNQVLALYARETGQGMSFPVERPNLPVEASPREVGAPLLSAVPSPAPVEAAPPAASTPSEPEPQGGAEGNKAGTRPSLKLVK